MLAPLDYKFTWMSFGVFLIVIAPFLMLSFILTCGRKQSASSKEDGPEIPPVVHLAEEKEVDTKMVVLEE